MHYQFLFCCKFDRWQNSYRHTCKSSFPIHPFSTTTSWFRIPNPLLSLREFLRGESDVAIKERTTGWFEIQVSASYPINREWIINWEELQADAFHGFISARFDSRTWGEGTINGSSPANIRAARFATTHVIRHVFPRAYFGVTSRVARVSRSRPVSNDRRGCNTMQRLRMNAEPRSFGFPRPRFEDLPPSRKVRGTGTGWRSRRRVTTGSQNEG